MLVSGEGLGFSGGALVALLGLRFPLLGAPSLVWDLLLVFLGRRLVYHWPEMSMYVSTKISVCTDILLSVSVIPFFLRVFNGQ